MAGRVPQGLGRSVSRRNPYAVLRDGLLRPERRATSAAAHVAAVLFALAVTALGLSRDTTPGGAA